MRQIKYGSILLVIAILQGCATKYIPIVDKSHIGVPQPQPITYTQFKWTVENGKQCLSQRDFYNLAENMSEVKRYIMQNSIIISEHNKLYNSEK